MEDNGVWPPTPTNQVARDEPLAGRPVFAWVLLLAVGSGSVLGLLDVCRADSLVDWLTGAMAAVLGFLHPKTFLLSAFILSLCLYLAHVVAILHGVKPPYVEPSVDEAIFSWLSLLSNGLGAILGAVLGLIDQHDKGAQGLKG